ncbi:GDSL esterase/lipase [Senna tora]|uniref:GDSL esterase/lipase n=1 Tax=Senna tora TaxID=362788 RepID=A0A834WUV0_9FABA|nr:GDSL esterase/lipase [Senna tora]
MKHESTLFSSSSSPAANLLFDCSSGQSQHRSLHRSLLAEIEIESSAKPWSDSAAEPWFCSGSAAARTSRTMVLQWFLLKSWIIVKPSAEAEPGQNHGLVLQQPWFCSRTIYDVLLVLLQSHGFGSAAEPWSSSAVAAMVLPQNHGSGSAAAAMVLLQNHGLVQLQKMKLYEEGTRHLWIHNTAPLRCLTQNIAKSAMVLQQNHGCRTMVSAF